uniref:Class II heat shock protein n=1 Tax=Tanacetum cinerariifolium TaxID=118510 RepID=A0A6L2P587_TANCI|nr:class II heat shock protein [Tanacetum cinerariifolium]
MALSVSDRNVEDALSKLLQRGTITEYQNEFEILISRVTGKSESLLVSIYIFGLKPALIRALLWSKPTTLGEAFALARATKAQIQDLEETTCHKLNKTDIITSLQSEVASLEAKGVLDANEEIKKAHTRVHELESNKVEETDLTSPDMVVAEDLGQKHIHNFDKTAMMLRSHGKLNEIEFSYFSKTSTNHNQNLSIDLRSKHADYNKKA